MNLKTAKDLLQKELKDPGSIYEPDLSDAQQLGLEALERHQENQAKLAFPEMHLLPSETKE